MKYKGKTPIEYGEEVANKIMTDSPRYAEANPNPYSFTYIRGVVLTGMEKIYEASGNKKYSDYIRQWLDDTCDESGRPIEEDSFWISLDSLDFRQAGRLMTRLYKETGNEKYLNGLKFLCESLDGFPKNSHGGFWHMKSHPNQMWLDGLYMVAPLLCGYAEVSGKTEYYDLAVSQAKLMYENMRDKNDGLLFHGWDDTKSQPWADKKSGLSPEKWGRAMGWFAAAVSEMYLALPSGYSQRDCIKAILTQTCNSLLNVRGKNGCWCEVIDKPYAGSNWAEESATALCTYALLNAARAGLGRKYAEEAEISFKAVIDNFYMSGDSGAEICGVCCGTCIDDGTYEHYINRSRVKNDHHGTGTFMMMCGAMEQLSKS